MPIHFSENVSWPRRNPLCRHQIFIRVHASVKALGACDDVSARIAVVVRWCRSVDMALLYVGVPSSVSNSFGNWETLLLHRFGKFLAFGIHPDPLLIPLESFSCRAPKINLTRKWVLDFFTFFLVSFAVLFPSFPFLLFVPSMSLVPGWFGVRIRETFRKSPSVSLLICTAPTCLRCFFWDKNFAKCIARIFLFWTKISWADLI